jgi:hypothetical protein
LTTQDEFLIEIIHKPVTFTNESLQKDTVELNKSLSEGYKIHEFVRTETGIVYVLGKWASKNSEKNSFVKSTQSESKTEEIS